MATVEKGLMNPHTEMQQSSSVNSTLNFMPAVPSWSVAPSAHDSYGAIWEAASSTTTTHHELSLCNISIGEGQGNMRSCINLMGRMAYVDHNVGGFNIMEGNMTWMGAKYNSDNDDNNNNSNAKVNNLSRNITIARTQEMQYLDPLSPHEEEGVSSSCVLQAQEEEPLMTTNGFLKRQGVVDVHDSPLLKKQRSSSISPKEASSKEDLAARNGSSEVGPALNTNGRPRAKRGSATDPQSVYARQRRERINERLKILQNLVPNGAKVDIVTMLEEAISYVKFLQLQVKLLSSDEYWMYAPTTYNGIDVSFDMLQHSS